jgi:hypothetical protein
MTATINSSPITKIAKRDEEAITPAIAIRKQKIPVIDDLIDRSSKYFNDNMARSTAQSPMKLEFVKSTFVATGKITLKPKYDRHKTVSASIRRDLIAFI